MAIFQGSGVAIVTPFKEGGILDFDRLGELIDWQVEQETDAIVIVGTTGEASCLYDDEHLETIAYAVQKTAGRLPVIAGVGSNQTEHGIKLSQGAQKRGASALLHVTPYYNKTSPRGLIEHFTEIANSVDLPILLYSVPTRTGMNIAPDVVAELAKHPNITGIKEASGNIAQVAEIARVTPDDFAIYSGNDDMIIPVLSLGGLGVISVLANVAPRDTHDMVIKYLDGDIQGACKLQLDMKPLIDALFLEVNPIPVKAALSMMGKCEYEYRQPLCRMEESNFEKLKKEMKAWGLI
ncbi:MAG: 4-hydroxy-tetrahydrodipicolinate synthase [Clostridiales Family XIII bacterium]|jgi:4-hydroxy-tetrahydrodipicolinate synthase|nr:4-hydroxy-tetrahydrodipicolinate synthase [Clostridiales Family XIII bacterium]